MREFLDCNGSCMVNAEYDDAMLYSGTVGTQRLSPSAIIVSKAKECQMEKAQLEKIMIIVTDSTR